MRSSQEEKLKIEPHLSSLGSEHSVEKARLRRNSSGLEIISQQIHLRSLSRGYKIPPTSACLEEARRVEAGPPRQRDETRRGIGYSQLVFISYLQVKNDAELRSVQAMGGWRFERRMLARNETSSCRKCAGTFREGDVLRSIRNSLLWDGGLGFGRVDVGSVYIHGIRSRRHRRCDIWG